MPSPFPASSSKPGKGHLVVHLLPYGISGLAEMSYQYPLKLISPNPSSTQKSILVFLLSYGGGLIGGDQVHLEITIHPSAKLSLVTQGHTKVFKSPSPSVLTSQTLITTLTPSSALCLLPDPIQPFADSVYAQTQIFTLHPTSSLALLDWISAGRTARAEIWDLTSFTSRNEIWLSAADPSSAAPPRLLLRDNMILAGDATATATSPPALPLKAQMHKLTILGTLLLVGPLLAPLAAFFLHEFSLLPRLGSRDFRSAASRESDAAAGVSDDEAWRVARWAQERADGVVWSVARVRGVTVVKFGAGSVEGARTWVGGMVGREGSVEAVFGAEAGMCLR